MYCPGVVISLLLVHFTSAQIESESNYESGQLVTVIAIYRHGDRTPINPYPLDPYKDKKYWPVGFGQLTNTGKEQQYQLGQWFRKRYTALLPEKYSERDIFVRSTDVDRTLMSAEANLAGLYPPIESQLFHADLAWQPIPVHTMPEKVDALLAMKKPCPKYDVLKQQLRKDPTIMEINKKNHDLFSYLARNSGKSITSLEEVEFVYNTLNIEKRDNFTLPKWTDKVYPGKMKPLADFSFSLPCYTKEMARLKVGPLFAEVIDHMYNVTSSIKHKYNRKLWMYSAHDTTVANVLKALDLFEDHSPPFAATILFEIRYVEKQFFVNILYKNSSDPMPMTLKACEYDCPLEKFIKILDPIAVNVRNWTEECKLSYMAYLPFNLFGDIVLLTVIFVTFFALSCILIAILFTKRKSEKLMYLRLPDDENV